MTASHTAREGYIKYLSEWIRGPHPDMQAVDILNRWRKPLYDHLLIGHDASLDVGYGNISIRGPEPGQFVVSGTRTGHIEQTSSAHYSLVTATDIRGNRVHCSGPIQASSEALTHAAIYQLDGAIGAVVHVHSRILWDRHVHILPTTLESVPYGTPEMAAEIFRLWRESNLPETGIVVMAGHHEGLVSFGGTLQQAAERLLALLGDGE